MSDVIEFFVCGLPPQSTSPNGRASWHKRHRDGDEYAARVWTADRCAGVRDEQEPWERAHLTLTQHAIRLRDHDNFYASFKPGQDTLTTKGKRPLGIVVDDTPECLSVTLLAQRVYTKADEGVHIRLERR